MAECDLAMERQNIEARSAEFSRFAVRPALQDFGRWLETSAPRRSCKHREIRQREGREREVSSHSERELFEGSSSRKTRAAPMSVWLDGGGPQ